MKTYHLKSSSGQLQALKTNINYKRELNREQLRVVQHADGPCLVLAGAGSGKTRTLVYRVAWLVEHGVHPQNILLVTFTNKAAREMMTRVQLLLKQEVKGLWGGTFHHIANRILRRYADRVDYQNNFAILDQSDSQELIASCVHDLDITYDKKIFPKSSTIQAMFSFTRNAQQPLDEVLAKQWKKFTPYITQLEQILNHYTHKKRQANVMDYDDLLVLWLQLLQEHSDIRDHLAQQFRYILVDEFQDTNRIQAHIMYELATVHNNILVVGDDAQSIYSFRAADISNILEFPKQFLHTTVFKLETNYRSTPEILTLANESIKHNMKSYKKKLAPVRDALNIKPGLVPLPDTITQAQFIVQRLKELHTDEGRSMSDIAVLFRASHQTLELEVELTKQNIAYIKRGGLKYFEQAHIKDVVAYLKVVYNPLDELSWRRVLKFYEGVGDKSAGAFIRELYKCDGNSTLLFEKLATLPISQKARTSLKKLYTTLDTVSALLINQGDNIASQLSQAIEAILSSEYHTILKLKYDDAEDRLEDLEQLALFAQHYPSIDQFFSDITLSEGFRGEIRGNPEEQSGQDYIVLSTIHQAKGLEWPTVFIIGLIEGQFPHSRALHKPGEVEEERRLFYVAVTRAKDDLYLTYPISSFFGSQLGRTFAGPSRFINELPLHVYDRWNVEGINYHDDFEEGVIDLLKE